MTLSEPATLNSEVESLVRNDPHQRLDEIASHVESDLNAVNEEILSRLESDVALINQMGSYIIGGGGKRLRPMTVLLASRALGYEGDDHITLAAVIEFIHTATLLHDDVVDSSNLRRGMATANDVWGNEAAVLVGDFLYSRSFEMMVEVNNMRVMEIMAETTNAIATGEVMQLLNCNDPETTEAQYLKTIHRKTARLFESAARISAVIAGQSREIEDAVGRYGLHLGTAFQMIDDLLDYHSDSEETGKNIGDDLAEGKATLPLIQAMKEGSSDQRSLISGAIEFGKLEEIDQIIEIIESTGAFAYTSRRAEEQAARAKEALAAIPDSPYLQALLNLADFAVARSF